MMTSRRTQDEDEDGKIVAFFRTWGPVITTAVFSAAVTWGITSARLDYMEKEQEKLSREVDKRVSVEVLDRMNEDMQRQHQNIFQAALDVSNRVGVIERRVDVNSNRLDAIERKLR
jgi:uncharacterized protein YllA (UPF0747 family)